MEILTTHKELNALAVGYQRNTGTVSFILAPPQRIQTRVVVRNQILNVNSHPMKKCRGRRRPDPLLMS